ncbi:MAG: Ig-like domain-containing protein [Candidatus Eisenbacteria bacterium]
MSRLFRLLLAFAAVAGTLALTSCAQNDLSNQVLQAHVGVTSVMPRNDSTEVSVFAPGVANFLDSVDSREAAVMTWTLTDAAGNLVPGTVSIGATQGRFTPDAPLQGFTAYRFTLTTGVRLQRGQLVRDAIEWSFTTGPGVTAARP